MRLAGLVPAFPMGRPLNQPFDAITSLKGLDRWALT
jgi:hypothetical protein